MIPFLHRTLVQALLDGVAALTTVPPQARATETDPVSATLQLLRQPLVPAQRPAVLFFEAEQGASSGVVAQMGELLGPQLCVDIAVPLTELERRAAARKLEAALSRLECRLDAKGNLAALSALVRSVLVVKPPLFASHPSLLGMVIVGPQSYLDEVDLTTLLLHEAVHQAIFLHDMLDPLFQSAARARMPVAYNPLLDAARPIDMCFHAAFVSYVVARVYAESGRPAEAAALLEPLGPCLWALDRGSSALTPRGKAYLEWLARHFAGDAWLKQALGEAAAVGENTNRAHSYSALHK